MRVGAGSLIRYLCHRLEPTLEDDALPIHQIERSLKASLSFSREGWAAGEKNKMGRSILDPSSVISRMYCVAIEKKLEKTLKRHQVSQPLPWVLRVVEDVWGWKAGEFLWFFGEEDSPPNRGPALEKELREARQHFPNLEYRADQDKEKDLVERMRVASRMIEESALLHVSHSKFHKEWDNLVPNYPTGSEEYGNAKQHWSSVVSFEIEEAVRECKMGVVLQAVGGHVLVAVRDWDIGAERVTKQLERVQRKWPKLASRFSRDSINSQTVSELKAECRTRGLSSSGKKSELVDRIMEDFGEEAENCNRQWAPALWGSWDEGACGVPALREEGLTEDGLVSGLAEEYDADSRNRESSRLRWANFGHHTRSSGENKGDSRVLYLDVMGLGEKCWSKKKVSYHCPECGGKIASWKIVTAADDLHGSGEMPGLFGNKSEWRELWDYENSDEGDEESVWDYTDPYLMERFEYWAWHNGLEVSFPQEEDELAFLEWDPELGLPEWMNGLYYVPKLLELEGYSTDLGGWGADD